MRVSLNFRSFDEELPVIGSEIHLIHTRDNIYEFTELFSKRVQFSFNCGDFGFDTEQEALDAGIEMTLNPDEAQDEHCNWIKMCPIDIDCVEGSLWIYSWDVDWNLMKCFPFQTKSGWEIAVQQGWITDVEYTTDEIVVHPKHKRDIHYSYRRCKIGDVGFSVTFCDDFLLDWDFEG